MKSGTGLVRDISPRGRVNPGDEGPRDRASGKEEEPRIKPDSRKQQASSHLSALSCRGWVPTVPPSPTPSPGTFYRPGSCSGDTESAGCRLGVRGALESPCGSPSACACWLTPGNRHLPLLRGGGGLGPLDCRAPCPVLGQPCTALASIRAHRETPAPGGDSLPARLKPLLFSRETGLSFRRDSPYTMWPPSSNLWLRIPPGGPQMRPRARRPLQSMAVLWSLTANP